MKKICIALDYNHSAEKVAKIGYSYAKALKAETTLVHVINEAGYYAIDYSPIMEYVDIFANTSRIKVVQELVNGAENFLSASAKHLGKGNIKNSCVVRRDRRIDFRHLCSKSYRLTGHGNPQP